MDSKLQDLIAQARKNVASSFFEYSARLASIRTEIESTSRVIDASVKSLETRIAKGIARGNNPASLEAELVGTRAEGEKSLGNLRRREEALEKIVTNLSKKLQRIDGVDTDEDALEWIESSLNAGD